MIQSLAPNPTKPVTVFVPVCPPSPVHLQCNRRPWICTGCCKFKNLTAALMLLSPLPKVVPRFKEQFVRWEVTENEDVVCRVRCPCQPDSNHLVPRLGSTPHHLLGADATTQAGLGWGKGWRSPTVASLRVLSKIQSPACLCPDPWQGYPMVLPTPSS